MSFPYLIQKADSLLAKTTQMSSLLYIQASFLIFDGYDRLSGSRGYGRLSYCQVGVSMFIQCEQVGVSRCHHLATLVLLLPSKKSWVFLT